MPESTPPLTPKPDEIIRWASQNLSAGNPLGALNLVGQRKDAHALAVQGVALAQLQEYDRARDVLLIAVREFKKHSASLWLAKLRAALAEIAFAQRDLARAEAELQSSDLRQLGDEDSAAYIDIQRARVLALLGRREEAKALLSSLASSPTAANIGRAELAIAEGDFQSAFKWAHMVTPNSLLQAQADKLKLHLSSPTLILRSGANEKSISLIDLQSFQEPFVDTIRWRMGDLDLRRRSPQLELLVALALGPVTPTSLFGRTSESLTARLRMEISRLRKDTNLPIVTTAQGYCLVGFSALLAKGASALSALPTVEAVLADGQAWPPRAIALVLGQSLRTVERQLKDSVQIEGFGVGRTTRYRLKNPEQKTATQLLLVSEAFRNYKLDQSHIKEF